MSRLAWIRNRDFITPPLIHLGQDPIYIFISGMISVVFYSCLEKSKFNSLIAAWR